MVLKQKYFKNPCSRRNQQKPATRFDPIPPGTQEEGPMKHVVTRLYLASLLTLCSPFGNLAAGAAEPPAPPVTANPPPASQPFVIPQGEAEREILPGLAQLTFSSQFLKAGEGYFSPDMKWVIFQGVPIGETQYQMYVAPLHLPDEAAGKPAHLGPPVRITPGKSRNTCGFFSPDNHAIIFASTAGKENPHDPNNGYQRKDAVYKWFFPTGMEIYRVDDWKPKVEAAEAELDKLMHHAPVTGSGQIHDQYINIDLAQPASRITDNNAYDAEDAYSPDGKWIVFTSMRTGNGEIFVMHPDGTHVVQITHAKGYNGGPFFSPDGKRLVYRSDRKGNDLLQLYVSDLAFDAEGNITGIAAEHQLTDDQNVNWGPFWYPDGRHLIFATSRHGHQNYELYTIRDDGSHATRITYTDGFDGLPAFSPDGKYLMWSAKRSADNSVQLFFAKFNAPKDW
jgi:Tol biopolymer transport system component